MNSVELYAEADRLTCEAMRLRREAYELRKQELVAAPRAKRLVYAADKRCHCGAGMAYDPTLDAILRHTVWRCSAVLLDNGEGRAHNAPFVDSDGTVMSEHDARAEGRTTRPEGLRHG